MQKEPERASHSVVFLLGCAPTQDVDEARVLECFSGTKDINVYIEICMCMFMLI